MCSIRNNIHHVTTAYCTLLCTLHLKCRRQPDIARANMHAVRAARRRPRLRGHIPVADVLACKIEAPRLLRAHAHRYILKASQNLCRIPCCGQHREVELHYVGPVVLATAAYRHGSNRGDVKEGAVATGGSQGCEGSGEGRGGGDG